MAKCLSDKELDEKWKSTARVVYEETTPKIRDYILIHSDLDNIDTMKDWKELEEQEKKDWCNWIYRGKVFDE